ncbi:DUF3857 domain-containing protein [Candidatus Protochlamydia phocaeensis]|uniref:DUF3857 domain-containing protein n=1 Tax=Candidatus Protochlamydia phocaeensis TaxID=1414722 RepID=UPI00083840ED|nr:DUF3857 domain-containing protein [Candidatus Protochlamydia phocaeensis]
MPFLPQLNSLKDDLLSPLPDWIAPLWPFEGGQSCSTQSRMILVEHQMHLQKEAKYYRLIYRIANDADVQQFSTLRMSFDPSYQTLKIHTLRHYRGNTCLDKLQTAHIRLIQREQDLEQHLYDGLLSAVIFLDDVREGDFIEYAYSVEGCNPAVSPHFGYAFYLGFSESVEHYFIRLIERDGHPLSFYHYLTDVRPVLKGNDSGKEWLWHLSSLKGLPYEDGQPVWHQSYPYVQISSFPDWQTVAEWGLKLFRLSSPRLEECCSQEMIELAREWQQAFASKEEQALCAVRFVQDKVRYLGIEDGINSVTPSDPVKVFKNRYGDCKDKTQLLRILLALLEIEAYPVLVNFHLSHTLPHHLPSHALFSHAILQIVMNGKTYWIDSTRSHQGGSLPGNYCADFRYGLVLKPETTALTPIQASLFGHAEFLTTFFLQSEKDTLMEVKSIYRGFEADYMRGYYQRTGQEKLSQHYEHAYANLLGNLKAARPLEITDDREENIFTTKECYSLESFFIKEDEASTLGTASIFPHNLHAYLTTLINPERTHPLFQSFPVHRKDVYQVIRSDQEWEQTEDEQHFSNQAFSYWIRLKADKQTFIFDFEYLSLSDHIKVEELSEHRQLLTKALEKSEFCFSMDFSESKVVPETKFEKAKRLFINGVLVCCIAFFAVLAIGQIIRGKIDSYKRSARVQEEYAKKKAIQAAAPQLLEEEKKELASDDSSQRSL